MIKLSRAALLAASLGLAVPAIVALPALAQQTDIIKTPEFSVSVSIPSVDAVESSMSGDQIKDVFSSNFLSLSDELARLTAASITIPEITVSFESKGEDAGKGQVTYRDVVLTNVNDGLVEKMTLGSGVASSGGETTTYGSMAIEGLDIKRAFELVGLVKGDPNAAFKPIYTAVTSDPSSQSGPMYDCKYDGSSSTMLEARPNSVLLGDIIALIEKNKGADEPPAEVIQAVVSYGASLLGGFKGGAGSVGAIDCDIKADMPVKLSIAKAASGGFDSGIYPQISVDGIAVDAGASGTGSLGQFLLKPIDFNPTLQALEANKDKLSTSWFDSNWRLLIPSFGGLSLTDLAIDAPNPDKPDQMINARVAGFDISLGNYVLGIPTDVSASASGVEVPLPEDSSDPQVALLRQAGITGVNMGFDVAAKWDEATSSIDVSKIALAAVDLGSMSVSASLANATDQLFAMSPDAAMNAALGLMVKNVTIHVTDDGLGQVVWPLAAKEQGKTDVQAFRTEMAGFAEGVALQLFGSTEAARQLGAAVGDFVTGRSGAVTITITSKDPAGIPIAYFMAAQNDPSILTGQIDVTGTAN